MDHVDAPTPAESAPTLPWPTLARVFLKVGAAAFGDTGPVLAMIERELIDRRGVLTRADLTEALTYTKLLPGSTVVQIVAYLGYRLGGWPASALATAVFVLPAAALMLALAAGYGTVAALPALAPTLTGLTAAVVGMLIATIYRLGKKNIDGPIALALAVAAFVVGVALTLNAALIVIVAGLLGVLLFTPRVRGTR